MAHRIFSLCCGIWDLVPQAGVEPKPPGGSDGKESACDAGDLGSISGSGRSPGEGNGYPFQYSCLENPMDGEPGRLWSMGVAESRLSG